MWPTAVPGSGCGPGDLDRVQIHDAFPIEELMCYELLGICGDGEGDRLVEEGATARCAMPARAPQAGMKMARSVNSATASPL